MTIRRRTLLPMTMMMKHLQARTILLNLDSAVDGDGPTAVIVTHRATGDAAGCGGGAVSPLAVVEADGIVHTHVLILDNKNIAQNSSDDNYDDHDAE